jgi:hypothetical protein
MRPPYSNIGLKTKVYWFPQNVASSGKTYFSCFTSKTQNFAERLYENTQTLLPFYFAKRSEKEISLKRHMEPDKRAIGDPDAELS